MLKKLWNMELLIRLLHNIENWENIEKKPSKKLKVSFILLFILKKDPEKYSESIINQLL